MDLDLIKAISEPLSVLATVSSIFLMGRPGRAQRWGIYVCLLGCIPWSVFALVTHSPFILAQNAVIAALNVYNLRNPRLHVHS